MSNIALSSLSSQKVMRRAKSSSCGGLGPRAQPEQLPRFAASLANVRPPNMGVGHKVARSAVQRGSASYTDDRNWPVCDRRV